ncbi:MAG TPA: SWIM zinc finger family protein [Spirochaetia bacterium]|nr:SWIM zinc finger family protein [Spirochaetia bacterium]
MSYYDYPVYVSVAEKKARAQKSIEKLRKKSPDITPIMIQGRKLARTWWGIAWNDNLESYSDYANRIGRGRSYVRHGAVLDLKISAGKIAALVQGSVAKPYTICIEIQALSKNTWETITKACEGKIDSLQELIEGKFPKGLAELFTARGEGLFPAPKEISLKCSCPDWAIMCKHVAAVLYGVGARLDENPALFFVLRNVNIDELVSKVIAQKSESLLGKSGRRSSRVIDDDDIGAMFGIDMEEGQVKASRKAAKKEDGVKKRAGRPSTNKTKREG